MKYIGIKLADGSFYPILEEGKPADKLLDLTTVQDNQTTVQIDLYRSATHSMDDAEYVDTLEIKHLQPHPNGEPDLNLKVSLNENNELNAEVTDPETGKTSETQVTLVSRTLAERNAAPVNFAIDEPQAEPEVIEDIPASNEDNTLVEDIDIPVTDDSSLSDADVASIEEKTTSELNSSTESADTVKEDNAVISPSPNSEDFSFDDLTIDIDTVDAKKKNTDSSLTETDSVAEFNTEEFEKAVAAETLSPKAAEEDLTAKPEVTESVPEKETTVEEPATAEPAVEEPAQTEAENLDMTLPDFSDLSVPESTDISTDTSSIDLPEIEEKSSKEETDSLFKESDYSVPDFDQPSPLPTGLTDYFEDPAFKEPAFTEPSIDDTSIDETAEKQSADEITSSDPTYNPQNDMGFSDLYDKETADGDSSANTPEDDVQTKTKLPVIICIICAVICIVATLLILFVIPSKINLIKSRNTRTEEVAEQPEQEPVTPVEAEPVAPAPEAETPEPVAPAVEDEVVVAPTPEVVPEQPPAPAEAPADIRYKIKWGDTLWDISDAYYKNPWRYHKLAKYNHIKNPDLIISGTYLLIPAE